MSQNFNSKSKVFDIKEHEERIDKLLSRRFYASFMSNSKWEKLFIALDVEAMKLDQVLLKRVDNDEPYKSYMPKTEDLEKIWVSEGKNDYNYFYKEIEWIELLNMAKPSDVPYQYYNQTIDLAETIIKSLGKFEIEKTTLGLRIYGYKT